MKNIGKIVLLSLFIALEVVLTRFLSITTPIVRIGFGFLPIALAGIFLGPAYGLIAGALSDLLGFFLFPSGTYFPGFTLTAALRGLIFGLVHYKNKVTINRVVISSVISTLLCDLVLNTIWLHILYGNAYSIMLVTRLIKSGIMIPISIFLIYTSWKAVKNTIRSNLYRTTIL